MRFLGHDTCKQHDIEITAFHSSLRLERLRVYYQEMLQYRAMIPVQPRGLIIAVKAHGLTGTSAEDPLLGLFPWRPHPHLNPRSERALPHYHSRAFHSLILLLLDKLTHTRFKNDR